MENKVNEVLKQLEMMAGGPVEIPPKVFKMMGGTYLEYFENKSMKISFPIKEEYENPVHSMFGGMIAAAFDNTYGPFSYVMVQKPCSTLELNVSYVRPASVKNKNLIVEVKVLSITKTQLLMEGKAHTPEGKLVATSTTRMMILGQ